jgi:uncharacterized membrane protein YfcA
LTAILSLFLGGLVGLALGLVGGGGSILTVPALIYGLGIAVHDAVPVSLVLVGLIAGFGAVTHFRNGSVRLDVALRFGLAGVLGAFLGARLSRLVDGRLLLVLFAVLMLVAAISLARRDTAARRETVHVVSEVHWFRVLAAGFGVGSLTGFFGVGGGFIIVPALALLVGLPTRQAVATSLVVIVINCASALLGHLTNENTQVPLGVLSLFALGGFAGSTGGARLAGRWPDRRLSRIFAALVAGVAVYLLARNLSFS